MGEAHHGGLGDLRVLHQSGLNLSSPNTVPRNVDHIVHSPGEEVIPVGVTLATVPGEVVPLEFGEVGLLEALVIPIYSAHNRGERLLDHQLTCASPLQLIPLIINNHRHNSEARHATRSRLQRHGSRQRRQDVAPGLGLPVGVSDWTPAVADHLVVPLPRRRVDGFAHSAEQLQGLAASALHRGVASAHQGTDGGGSGVELGDLVFVNHFPASGRRGVGGHSLEEHLCGAFQHGSVGNVGVPRDPAAVRGAPVHVPGVVVKRIFKGGFRADHVPRRGVHHTLGLTGGPRGVEHKQGVLGVHPGDVAGGGLGVHKVGPLDVAGGVPLVWALGRIIQTHDHNSLLDGEPLRLRHLAGLVGDVLQHDGLGSAHHAIGGDEYCGLGVTDAA
mmetsp:Transcript_6057/g.13031  ORF Transcript_6057/g.13031 Transcript_6057/m.13031 type:complete len:387 (+) Transcript_6057:799-1959(+)